MNQPKSDQPITVLMGRNYATKRQVRYDAPDKTPTAAKNIYLDQDAIREAWGDWPDGVEITIRPIGRTAK